MERREAKLRSLQLVGVPTAHDALLNALARTADGIAVQVAVHIIHGLDFFQIAVDVKIILVKGVFRKLEARFPQ